MLCIDRVFGVCVKTIRPFYFGELIAVVTSDIILRAPKLHTVQVAPNLHIYDKWFAGRITHSCEPNMIFDQSTLTFYSIRYIKAGEILTQDYELTEDILFRPFVCKCESPKCRGYIAGKNYADPNTTEYGGR